jgi:hypothetical protein
METIELVLVLCLAAAVLALAFKYLWGKDSSGILAKGIGNVTNQFFTGFMGDISANQ